MQLGYSVDSIKHTVLLRILLQKKISHLFTLFRLVQTKVRTVH